ncbi:MAG: cadmium-translocating P-type ATPase [Leptospirales bacterium]|nr:cadmium-translocating P-type ATPase [Leptospirales bacterium]
MIKEFTLQGLNCANCAAKIENSAKALDGVSHASVNFITTTLQIKIGEDYPKDIHKEIERIVHKHEPDICVLEKTNLKQIESGNYSKAKIIRLIIGALILGAGIVFERVFEMDEYITLAVFIFGYLLLGAEIILLAFRNIVQVKIFDENFLMTIATIGAFAIGEYAEGVGVMLFYQVGVFFQDLAVQRSKKTISKLMEIRPDYANIQVDGQINRVSPETVQINDIIIVKPGEKIPLDGVVIEGEAMLDTTALTGESVPRKVSVSDTVLSGCVNQNAVLTIKVTQTFGESTASKIIDLALNAANKKAPTENFITKFALYYTPIIVGLAALIAVIPPLMYGGEWSEWLRRGLIFLVISCPCALVISIPLGFFGGIGAASKNGILVKGGNYLEALNSLDFVVFDKTGTLTKGVFKVTTIQPVNGFSEAELLEAAASAEAFSNHPIALSILKEYGKDINKNQFSEYSEIAGHGVSVNASGKTFLAGNKKLMEMMGVAFEEVQNIGTKVYVAIDGVYAGCIIISDEIRHDSYDAIAALKALGVRKTVMLTGDNPQIAETIANELKLDEVHAGLLPGQKVEKVEMLNKQKRTKGKLAFVGDGINDAPVLAMADVGVAMGGLGSDAAIEAADIVLMTDEPLKMAEAVEIARFTKRIVWQNIIFALGVKSLFLLLGAMGVANMLEAVFADVGVAILAIFNSMRVMNK